MIDKISSATIIKIADSHINRYDKMLKSNSEMVNKQECSMYKTIWVGIKTNAESKEFTKNQKNELYDALYDGSYDEYLLPEEFKLVKNTIGDNDV